MLFSQAPFQTSLIIWLSSRVRCSCCECFLQWNESYFSDTWILLWVIVRFVFSVFIDNPPAVELLWGHFFCRSPRTRSSAYNRRFISLSPAVNWSDADDCRAVADSFCVLNDESGGARRASSASAFIIKWSQMCVFFKPLCLGLVCGWWCGEFVWPNTI